MKHKKLLNILKIRKFSREFYMRGFVKIKPSIDGEIILSFTDFCTSCPILRISNVDDIKICHLMLFVKINFSRKFPNPQ